MKNRVNTKIGRMVPSVFSALGILITFLFAVGALPALDKSASANPAKAEKKDLRKIAHIHLELDDVLVDRFMEVDGIESKTEIIEVREGGEPSTSRKVVGRTSYSNIRLRKGSSIAEELWQWRKKVVEGAANIRKSGSIVFVAEDGTQLSRYKFYNAWPAGWKAGMTEDRHFVEEMELAVESWEKHYP